MADFNFFLNRQGVRGNKGEQGEQGYSPRITVKTETAAEYVLNVQNEDGSFDTPNLRGNAIENLGGTYVRFDQDTEQMYTGYADTASTTSQGEVVLSTYADLANGGDESEVTTSKDVYDFVEAKISEASVNYVDIDDYTQKMNELDGEISDLDDNKLDFTDLSSALVAGTNITITPNAQTGKITIAGEPVSQAQADWNQTDTSAPDYIKNKPTIPEAITVDDDFSTTSTNPVENRLITNAINLISNELEDFAEKDLSNLSADGEARLHALKAYSDNGEILTDAKGLSSVISYAHSTFGRSKFTVVGSPNVTDDGIASGFSNSNYYTFTANCGNTTIQTIKFKVSSLPSAAAALVNNNNFNTILQYVSSSQKHFPLLIVNDGTNSFALRTSTVNIVTNTTYIAKFTYNNSTYELGVYLYDKDWNLLDSITHTATNNIVLPTTSQTFNVGKSDNSANLILDLKYLSMTADDIPIFTGNKTGIDTIKPDDYTEVNSPVISNDGVMTLDDTNAKYVTTSSTIALSTANTWKIESPVFTLESKGTAGTDIRAILGASPSSSGLDLFVRPDGKPHWLIYKTIGDNTSSIVNKTLNTPLLLDNGTKYQLAIEFTGTAYKLLLSTNGSAFTQIDTIASMEKVTYNPALYIGYRANTTGKGTMDLNLMHVYVDGNLVYQPCLKIPYTEGSGQYGGKYANAQYLPRVKDAYEQGLANGYFTLDEVNGTYTLPMGNLYGMIEKVASTVPSGVVQSSSINNIVSLTQTEYDNLATKDANTFYIITPSS